MSEEDEKQKEEYNPEEDDNEIEKLSKKNSRKNDENIDNQEEYNIESDKDDIVEKPKKKKNKQLGKKTARPKKMKKKKAKIGANFFIDEEASEDDNDEESNVHFQGMAEEHRDEINEEEANKKPTKDDPKMWIVKCRIGDEKSIVQNLYHKYFFFKKQNKPKDRVKIYSITSFENLKGKIYIEAHTERDVLFAIQDMSNVNHNSIQLVPVNQRPQIFQYDQKPKSELFKNQLVRIKGGNYEGDLAKVVYIEDPMNKIYVALVPRIIDDVKGKKGYNVASFGKQKSFLRPRQKLFDRKNLTKEENENYSKIMHEPYGEVIKFRNFKFMDGLLIRPIRRVMIDT